MIVSEVKALSIEYFLSGNEAAESLRLTVLSFSDCLWSHCMQLKFFLIKPVYSLVQTKECCWARHFQ